MTDLERRIAQGIALMELAELARERATDFFKPSRTKERQTND